MNVRQRVGISWIAGLLLMSSTGPSLAELVRFEALGTPTDRLVIYRSNDIDRIISLVRAFQ